MKRFCPSTRPSTLQNKANEVPVSKKIELHVAKSLGMDADAKVALERIEVLSKSRKIGVFGRFMPSGGVSKKLATLGIPENVEPEDFFRFRTIVIPYCGVPARLRREWEEAGQSLEDLTSPQVRRAQVALGLLKMEGAQALVIGRHDDPETLAITGGNSAARVIEDTTDSSRLLFAPAFGAVCQTTLSPRRVSWLVQQLRLRWRDARVTFLDTVSPAMLAREEALERLMVVCDRAIIVGELGESSCEALVETAARRSKPATIISGPDDLSAIHIAPNERIAFSAGAFTTDEDIRAVAERFAEK